MPMVNRRLLRDCRGVLDDLRNPTSVPGNSGVKQSDLDSTVEPIRLDKTLGLFERSGSSQNVVSVVIRLDD